MGTELGEEFIRFNPVLGDRAELTNMRGVLYFEVFTVMGKGPTRAYLIADLIEKYFLGQTFDSGDGSSVTQFSRESNLNVKGESKVTSLLLTEYQIKFNYFRKEV